MPLPDRKAGSHKMVVKAEIVNERAISFHKKMRFTVIGKAWENVEGIAVHTRCLERAP